MTTETSKTRRATRPSSSAVRVAITQMTCGAEPRANRATQLHLLEKAAKGGTAEPKKEEPKK
jgi:hypothetical protein